MRPYLKKLFTQKTKTKQNKNKKQNKKKTLHKNMTGGAAQGEGPKFKSWYHKKKGKGKKER
jgi:hypothetical protein